MSVAAVKGQCQTLLGRLEVLKLGTAAATGMRGEVKAKEPRWRRAKLKMIFK